MELLYYYAYVVFLGLLSAGFAVGNHKPTNIADPAASWPRCANYSNLQTVATLPFCGANTWPNDIIITDARSCEDPTPIGNGNSTCCVTCRQDVTKEWAWHIDWR